MTTERRSPTATCDHEMLKVNPETDVAMGAMMATKANPMAPPTNESNTDSAKYWNRMNQLLAPSDF